MFSDNIEPIISNEVATVYVKVLIPKGVGTVSWSWTYYLEQFFATKFNNVLNFPDSPVNILSATELSESMKYDEGT